MAIVWKVMTGLAGGGLLTAFFLKEIAMHTATDNTYGLEANRDSKASSQANLEAGEGEKSPAAVSAQSVAEPKVGASSA